jgi:putative nucleotidyltransferase with HDIG domain
VAGHALFRFSRVAPLHEFPTGGVLFLPLIFFTVLYFLVNSWLVALAVAIEKRSPALPIWQHEFSWLALNYFGASSVAVFLVHYGRGVNPAVVALIAPLLIIFYLGFKTSLARMEDATKHLQQLSALYLSTSETLAMAIDAKDQVTHGHIRRVQAYAVGLAKAMGVTDDAELKALEAAGLLHDMGKLAIPEHILKKPGLLKPAEFEKMKRHTTVGATMLAPIQFPYPVVPIVRHHHENWDGTGYPDRLKGEEIPIGARILAVVDCFDALTSDRPYRPRMSSEDAFMILTERRGKMYDPPVVDAFMRVYREIAPAALAASHDPVAAAVMHDTEGPDHDVVEEMAPGRVEALALYELARALSDDPSPAHLCQCVAQHLQRVLPSAIYVLYVDEPDSDELVVCCASENAEAFNGFRVPRGERLTGWVAVNRRTIANSDSTLDLHRMSSPVKHTFRSSMATAVVDRGELLGVLSLYAPSPYIFADDHVRIVEAAAGLLAAPLRAHLQVNG